MGWVLNVAAPAMLWGLAGVSIPVIIHLLNRRRAAVIDWGAMQFLDLGRRARRRFQITEWLLLAGRMALLALVALAVARPFLAPRTIGADAAGAAAPGLPRDVVLVLDGSESMARMAGGATPRDRAIRWARAFVKQLPPGSTVAVLDARDRVRPLVDPPAADRAKVDAALADAPAPRGSSDLPAAVGEALRLLDGAKNTARDVVVLSDGQRHAWRPGEAARWALLRDLHGEMTRRRSVRPRLWSVALGGDAPPEGADGAVKPLELARGLIPPGLPLTVTAAVANAGPGPLTRDAELLVDGVPVPAMRRRVGPIPPGGTEPVTFQAAIPAPGSHLLTVRLDPGDDPLPTNDAASRPVEVAEALPVLLVDGEPGGGPLAGEAAFLRAALAPADDATPAVRAAVVPAADFAPGDLKDQRVLVLANVERLDPPQAAAVSDFLARGGGVLVVAGDRTDADSFNEGPFRDGAGWLPARLGEIRGDFRRREPVAHPDPRRFNGPVMGPFGRGEAPPLGRASLFGYRVLEPATAPAAAVLARLDTGEPWLVERPAGRGRAAVLAGPLDAEGGTLPVNPDFVPWVHTLVFHLADPAASDAPLHPGEPIRLELAREPDASVKDVAIRLPDGREERAEVLRQGGRSSVRFAETVDPGMYRITLPEPVGGFAYVLVESDGRESDPAPLEPAEAERLAEGWPLTFESDGDRLAARLLAGGDAGSRPLWRWLVLAALGGLCLEVVATRRIALARGLTGGDDA